MQLLLDDYRVGAAVATDLVNSAPEVMARTGDLLPDAAALARFLTDRDLLPAAEPTTADVAAVHALRRTLRALLEKPDPERLAALTAATGGLDLTRDTAGRW